MQKLILAAVVCSCLQMTEESLSRLTGIYICLCRFFKYFYILQTDKTYLSVM